MAKCEVCEQDMLVVDGCTTVHYFLEDGTPLKPVPVGMGMIDHAGPGERCHDCNAEYGKHHHIGCDNETCASCGLQFIGCDCAWSDKIEVYK